MFSLLMSGGKLARVAGEREKVCLFAFLDASVLICVCVCVCEKICMYLSVHLCARVRVCVRASP